MTEQEWLACTDPASMVELLRGKASDRKLRLFGVYCCRRSDVDLFDERCLRSLDVAERFAEGAAGVQELEAAWGIANDAYHEWDLREGRTCDALAARAACERRNLAGWVAPLALPLPDFSLALLHDLFGNPFRPAPALDPAWLAWNDGTVAKLAAAIYEEHRFADLPILADALEDAGCADAAILAHCRGSGEHLRGCWVVDLLTGRQ